MTKLILGLILWIAGHFFKRAMPQARARMGKMGKGVVGAVLLTSVVLMVTGFRGAGDIPVWSPPFWAARGTVLFMVIAVVLMGLGHSKSRLRGLLRHPMLTGMQVWAVAHLLVNGDLASIVLFGTLFIWATAEVMVLNRAEPDWQRPEPGTLAGDVKLAVITVVIYVAIVGVHYWLGYPVF